MAATTASAVRITPRETRQNQCCSTVGLSSLPGRDCTCCQLLQCVTRTSLNTTSACTASAAVCPRRTVSYLTYELVWPLNEVYACACIQHAAANDLITNLPFVPLCSGVRDSAVRDTQEAAAMPHVPPKDPGLQANHLIRRGETSQSSANKSHQWLRSRKTSINSAYARTDVGHIAQAQSRKLYMSACMHACRSQCWRIFVECRHYRRAACHSSQSACIHTVCQ